MTSSALRLSYEEMLKEFHTKYDHLIEEKPTLEIPETVKILRAKLIVEEVFETLIAMGMIDSPQEFKMNFNVNIENQDLDEIADGIADSIYVLVGTAISYGIPIDRIFREVHNSNMTKTAAKVEPGQKYGTKTPKGPDFEPPDIFGILNFPELSTKLEIKEKLVS